MQRTLCTKELGVYKRLYDRILQAPSTHTHRNLPLCQQSCTALKAAGNTAGHLPPDELLANWKAMLTLSSGQVPTSLAALQQSRKLPPTAAMLSNAVAVGATPATGTGHSTRGASAGMQAAHASLTPVNATKVASFAKSRSGRAQLQTYVRTGQHHIGKRGDEGQQASTAACCSSLPPPTNQPWQSPPGLDVGVGVPAGVGVVRQRRRGRGRGQGRGRGNGCRCRRGRAVHCGAGY